MQHAGKAISDFHESRVTNHESPFDAYQGTHGKQTTSHRSPVTIHYLIASGFTGEATAPVTGNAGATNMNS